MDEYLMTHSGQELDDSIEFLENIDQRLKVLDNFFIPIEINWYPSNTYPTGWRGGYFTGGIGSSIGTNTTNSQYIRTVYRISDFGSYRYYPRLTEASYIRVTPPSGYTVECKITFNDVITDIIGTKEGTLDYQGKPILIQHTAGQEYYISIGKFASGEGTSAAADTDFCNSIKLEFMCLSSIRYDINQNLTEDQLITAQSNIGLDILANEIDSTRESIIFSEKSIKYWDIYQDLPSVPNIAHERLQVIRDGEVTTVHGTTSSSTDFRANISGLTIRSSLINTFNAGQTVHLKANHTYLFSGKKLNGSCTSKLAVEIRPSSSTKLPLVDIDGNRLDHDNIWPEDNESGFYTSDTDKDIAFILYLASEQTADNYKFIFTCQDITEAFDTDSTIKILDKNLKILDSTTIKKDTIQNLNISTTPTFSIPHLITSIDNYIVDAETEGNVTRKFTQGICSDGQRYIYYPLATAGHRNTDNFYVNVDKPLIKKWDTWYNRQAAYSGEPTVNYGHCEDMAFVPADFSGFDNGSVDRIYILDNNHSPIYDGQGNVVYDGSGDAEHTTNKLVHVINANDLSYITSFPSIDLSAASELENWNGINHICVCPTRGLIVTDSPYKVGDDTRRILAIFNDSGILQSAIDYLLDGSTMVGWDCDENFIYVIRYGSFGKGINIFDYNLNPIKYSTILDYIWELEGMCHIGNNLYLTWNQEVQTRKGAVIANGIVSRKSILPIDTVFPVDWSNTNKLRLNSITQIYPTT